MVQELNDVGRHDVFEEVGGSLAPHEPRQSAQLGRRPDVREHRGGGGRRAGAARSQVGRQVVQLNREPGRDRTKQLH